MKPLDSGEIKNNLKVSTVVIAIIIHLALALATFGISLLVTLIIGLITLNICNTEIATAQANENKFKKSYPFKYFGVTYQTFEHAFYHQENIEAKIVEKISSWLSTRTPISRLEQVTITDVDNELKAQEGRLFYKSDTCLTKRGTSITLVIRTTTLGKIQSVRWWVQLGGFLDANKKFTFIVYSPLSFVFWIIPYLKKEYDLLSHLRNIYVSDYNNFDIINMSRCLHETVFDAMVASLEENGIDVSDLKAQKGQVTNINVSGGGTVGNIVQGQFNRVLSSLKHKTTKAA